MRSCNRCGQCCYYFDDDGIKRPCRFLVNFGDNLTSCRIYNNRLGTIIYKGVYKLYKCVKVGDAGTWCRYGGKK